MKNKVSCDLTWPYTMRSSWCIEGSQCLHLQCCRAVHDPNHEDEGTVIHQNARNFTLKTQHNILERL